MSTRLAPEAYLEQIRSNSARFVEVLAPLEPGAPVPSCPGWSADDLLDHLRGVQHFWAGVVGERVTDDADVEGMRERRPVPEADDHAGRVAAAREASHALVAALDGRSPEEAAWSWSPDRSVGFTCRRQAHEACMHRIDAELTASPDGSARSLVDSMLATDGVDEVLGLSATFTPARGTPDDRGRLVRVVASDTGATWLVTVGTESGIDVAGHDPADGTVRPSAILTGTAEDLLCSFWGRPPLTSLHRTGDHVLLADLDRAVAARPGG